MAIPDYQACMLPLLEAIADGSPQHIRDLVSAVANQFGLNETEKSELLPSGQQTVISNRVQWAKTYLKKAGLIANPSRGTVQITEEGLRVLSEKPSRIDTSYLKRFENFVGFFQRNRDADMPVEAPESVVTPEEAIEQAHRTLRDDLADELLERVRSCSPEFFERLVVDLLVRMGYGGSLADAGQAIGRSHDNGIDGIIKEDQLGLDVLCIQAKRWESTVGRPVVQAFAGSMEGFRAKKGVLITTSAFSKDAEEYVTRIERKIVLIGGRRLAELMIEHNVGVAGARTFVIKKVDLDYFDEE